jgi:hypothetical protein
MGEVIDYSEELLKMATACLDNCTQVPNLDIVNEYLINMRSKYLKCKYFEE